MGCDFERDLAGPIGALYFFTMSEPARNLFDDEDLDAKARAVAEARAQLDAGQGVPNDAVKAWLKDLAAGRRRPPPCG